MRLKVLLFLALAFVSTHALFSQVSGTGKYSFGSFDNKGFDTINLGNLNVHFEIPIINKQGRGLPFTYSLVYDGLVWSNVSSAGNTYWYPDSGWGFHGNAGSTLLGQLISVAMTSTTSCSNGDIGYQSGYEYKDPYGRVHVFNIVETLCGESFSYSGDGSTNDGSGYTFNNGAVYSADGKVVTFDQAAVYQNPLNVDKSGNTITNNQNGTFTDTLGVTALTVSGDATSSSPVSLTFPVAEQANPSTTTSSDHVYYKTYSVQTNFQCSGIGEWSGSVDLVDHVTLADGSTYAFTYETTTGLSGGQVTGRLASVTLPTGGVISYQYGTGCPGAINMDGTPSNLTRTASDPTGHVPTSWKTYSHNINSYPLSANTTSDDQGNETDYGFVAMQDGNLDDAGLVYETNRTVWQGAASSNSALDVVTVAYNGQTSGAALTGAITQTDVTESPNGISPVETVSISDSYGNITSVVTKDPISGATLYQLANTYQTLGSLRRPTGERLSSSTVTDPTQPSNIVSQTTYGYADTTQIATSGIPQFTAEANQYLPTSVHIYTGTSTPTLDSIITYYNTGVQYSVQQSVAGTSQGTTTYSYDSTQGFLQGTAYPTPSSGQSMSISSSYDVNSGGLLSSTGLNSGQTNSVLAYDPLMRPLEIQGPATGNAQPNAQINYNYAANQVGIDTTQTTGQVSHQITFLDAFGRLTRTATSNGTLWYLTDTCYDSLGMVQYQSVSYPSSTQNPTSYGCSSTTADKYSYDASGKLNLVQHPDGSSTQYNRIGHSTKITSSGSASSPSVQKILQYDKVGNLSSVCEISSNSSLPSSGTPVSCGADQAGTGFLTAYAYNQSAHTTTITQGAQSRTFQTDAAGRTISISEPEAGTTTYSYSYNATGPVVVRARPRANVPAVPAPSPIPLTHTTTQYDLMGRMLSISYDDGTPTKNFSYDQSTNGGSLSLGHSIGQMTQASTTNGSTVLHNRYYVYDIMGRVTETDECLPDWCGQPKDIYRWYGYDAASEMISETFASGTNGTVPIQLQYSYNQAGQPSGTTQSVNSGTPSTIYSVSAQAPTGPLVAQLGNGLFTVSGYDSRGRASSMSVCGAVSSNACSGSPLYSYTANFQGKQLASSSDTVEGPGSYSYDEFGRLLNVNGTNTTQQPGLSFTYDRYGNRYSQAVTAGSGPQPSWGFNSSTNQLMPTTGYQYDVAGNVIYDGSHNYTYDAENNLTQIDGGTTASYAFDAFNERVKVSDTSTNQLIGVDLQGRWSTIWDEATGVLVKTQYYNGARRLSYWDGDTHYQHQDWLGTERARTGATGALESTFQSLPFGDGFTQASGTTDSNTGHFAMLDHDGAFSPGLEHAFYREYQASVGRWLSSDSYSASYVFTRPQSLNRYAYASSKPLSAVDPSGREEDDTGCNDPTCEQYMVYYMEDGGGGGGGGAGDFTADAAPCPADACVTADPSPGVDFINLELIGIIQGNSLNFVLPQDPNSNKPKPQPTPQPPPPVQQQPLKPWYCGTGNSWSHPFTAPTSRQWGLYAGGDTATAFAITKYSKGTASFAADVFTVAAIFENYAWAACGD